MQEFLLTQGVRYIETLSDIETVKVFSYNCFMGWQILKQLYDSIRERRKLTLLRESTPIRK